jgi:hypothetical protein
VPNILDEKIVEPDRIETPPRYTGTEPQRLTADTARQAPRGTPVLYVLVVSTLAAALCLGAYWAFWAASL